MSDQNAEDVCEFATYDSDGKEIFKCDRTDTEIVAVGVGPDPWVRICSRHRSWISALGKAQ